jgi:hypothetical protein
MVNDASIEQRKRRVNTLFYQPIGCRREAEIQAWRANEMADGVVFQKWRWTEIAVTLGLVFVASIRTSGSRRTKMSGQLMVASSAVW